MSCWCFEVSDKCELLFVHARAAQNLNTRRVAVKDKRRKRDGTALCLNH